MAVKISQPGLKLQAVFCSVPETLSLELKGLFRRR
jgi:hypothetical protein